MTGLLNEAEGKNIKLSKDVSSLSSQLQDAQVKQFIRPKYWTNLNVDIMMAGKRLRGPNAFKIKIILWMCGIYATACMAIQQTVVKKFQYKKTLKENSNPQTTKVV